MEKQVDYEKLEKSERIRGALGKAVIYVLLVA